MRIMHVIDGLQLGGAERMLVDIANATAEDGHAVSVCVTRTEADLGGELRRDVPLWILGRQKRFDWLAMWRFAKKIRADKIELLHAHQRSTFAFLALLKTLGLVRVPIVLHDHFGQIEIDQSVPLWFRAWGRFCVGHYVGVYQRLADWAAAGGVDRSRIDAIGNAQDLRRLQQAPAKDLRREFSIRDDELIGITVAGLRHEKGIHVLLAALAQRTSKRLIKILVVGGTRDTGYVEKCRAQTAALRLEGTVIFAGERADVPGLINGADFALLPSISESGPLVLVEYMAGGLPFVATRVGDISNRVATLGVPDFVAPDDAAGLAQKLDRLLSLSNDEWVERKKLGRKVAQKYFDLRATMPQWYAVYQKTLRAA
ncbi:MAG: glycosyltransferase [Verrucomicrobia bacterium]|nr:glycosyltransferase [Verrucomicrobiota bacterium]